MNHKNKAKISINPKSWHASNGGAWSHSRYENSFWLFYGVLLDLGVILWLTVVVGVEFTSLGWAGRQRKQGEVQTPVGLLSQASVPSPPSPT